MDGEGINLSRGLPGETPLADTSGLKLRWIRTVPALSRAEFANIAKAIYKYTGAKPSRRKAPFTSQWLRKVHFEMYSEVWRWAGIPRKVDLNIGVPWQHVEVELQNLIDDIGAWQVSPGFGPTEPAAAIHHRAVYIHPFMNGNGRWARLLANIWLYRNADSLVRWPEDRLVRHASPIRTEYILALKEADKGNIGPLVELHRRYEASPA